MYVCILCLQYVCMYVCILCLQYVCMYVCILCLQYVCMYLCMYVSCVFSMYVCTRTMCGVLSEETICFYSTCLLSISMFSLSINQFYCLVSPLFSLSLSLSLYIYIYIYIQKIGLGVRAFANGPGDLGSIPGRVIPKTQKMVLDASLLNTQHYKVRIKGKVEQSRERISALPYTLV